MQDPALGRNARRLLKACAAGSLVLLAACGADGGPQAAPSASSPVAAGNPPPVSAPSGWAGRYVGTITIGGTTVFGDALVTADGALVLYVGGPYSDDGTVQQTAAPGAMQLSGTLAAAEDHATAQGLVRGENCAADAPGRFCGAAASATMTLAITSGNLVGEVAVTGAAGDERWSLELAPWTSAYLAPATRGALAGGYQELVAEFAIDGDTSISIDGDGNLSFHSPHSGCSGAGSIQPRTGGTVAVNVYDVKLSLSGCGAAYAYLNADYQGLATTTPSSVWAYDALLRMWLTAPAAGAAPALTTLADPR